MTKNINKENLEFDSSITRSETGSPILGRITGPCADIVAATRNGRRYSEALWERVFKDPIVNEYFEAGGIFGELNHPTDREETDLEKVAICMAKPPVKNSEGKLIGTWDILNTPNGRIAKCLFDYGYKLGISSRGSGDTYTDYDGQESVDPESYTLQGFDLVYLPAVKAARLTPVKESLDLSRKTLRKALNEALESSTEDERKIMTETLNKLKIDYSPEDEVIEETVQVETTTPEKDNNIDVESSNEPAADNDGADLVNELQEALKTQTELEVQVKELQEKLSVCYTKEARYSNTLLRTKTQLEQAQEANTTLTSRVTELEESLKERDNTIIKYSKQLSVLNEQLRNSKSSTKTLNESLNSSQSNISALEKQVKTLNESLKRVDVEHKQETKKLEESLAQAQTDVKITKSQCNAKLEQAQQLVEKYKNVAKTAVDKYIKSQAIRIGVKEEDIKKRLNESYSFNDIDKACEDLQSYKLNVNSLPFRVGERLPSAKKMRIIESKEVIEPTLDTHNFDDDIDETLLNIIR